jgi:hypothetical protein
LWPTACLMFSRHWLCASQLKHQPTKPKTILMIRWKKDVKVSTALL